MGDHITGTVSIYHGRGHLWPQGGIVIDGTASYEAAPSIVCDRCDVVLTALTVEALALAAIEQGWRVGAPDTTDPDVCGECA